MEKRKLFVPDYKDYADPFLGIFDLVDEPEDADVLMLTGGADILPSHYGEPPHKSTYHSPNRDKYEKAYIDFFMKQGKPILGICRGAQWLCTVAGGKLVQDCDNHGTWHPVTTSDGLEMITSSLHHQMMRLENTKHELLAWSTHKRSRRYLDGWGNFINYGNDHKEPEVVFFPDIKGLGIQGHPEMMSSDSEFVKYCNEQVVKYLF